jgi:DUF3054 family protein
MAGTRPRASIVWFAAAADVVLVLLFVLIGRGAHEEGLTVLGTLVTWWPFLVGLAVGWFITVAWRRPLGIVLPGVVIWLATVGIGMLLRLLSGQGIALAFVIVATVTLAVFLLGWRAIAGLVSLRARQPG